MRLSLAAAVAALLLTAGCGYIAGTVPPKANVPATPQDVAATQRGANVLAHFTVPALTTENSPIQGALELDLRAGPSPGAWNESAWAAQARRFLPKGLTKIPAAGRNGVEKDIAEYEFTSEGWSGKEIIIAARVTGANGKMSNWSAPLALPVVAPLAPPTDLTATPLANGIRLTWGGAGNHFRVMRKVEGAEGLTELAVTTAPEYLDSAAEVGKRYTYETMAFAEVAPHQEAQSDLSAGTTILYEDKFPPAAPAGLRAISSPASVELSWDSNSDTDLAGYRVYRSADGGPFTKIADVNEIPTYSDGAAQAGKTYRYAVTAVDKSGNESGRSAEAEARLQ